MDFIKRQVTALLISSVIYAIALFYGTLTALRTLYQWAMKGNEYFAVKERTLPPPCLQDIKYGRHSYIRLKTDIKIHYVENGDRSKPLMLLVHGFPEFWFCWRNQLTHFSKTHWVVAMDMRGYGDSDKPKATSAYAMNLLENDIVDFVKALKRDDCILVAHDWGGAISWSVAAKYPEVIKKLIIMNAPHPGAFSIKLKGSFKQFLKSWYIFFFQLPYLPELVSSVEDLAIFKRLLRDSVTDEDLEGYKYIWSRKGSWTPPINYYRNLLTPKMLLNPPVLPKILAPTLIIWGENDLALDKDLAELCKQFVNDISIEYIKNGSHFVQEDKPDEVNKVMNKFLGIK